MTSTGKSKGLFLDLCLFTTLPAIEVGEEVGEALGEGVGESSTGQSCIAESRLLVSVVPVECLDLGTSLVAAAVVVAELALQSLPAARWSIALPVR